MGSRENTLEMQVQLGLTEAQKQIKDLGQLLQDSVKLNSSSFSDITKYLAQATKQADKLTGKMGEAFKTSSGSKSFLHDYQQLLETLTIAKTKLSNIGIEDIKFSSTDQQTIDKTVKSIETLESTLERMKAGKALTIIENSQVTGIDNLKKQIDNLKEDVSEFTFDQLKQSLITAASEAKQKISDIRMEVKQLDNDINSISTSGMSDIKNAVESTAANGSIIRKLVNPADITDINEKLRIFAQSLTTIPASMKNFIVGNNDSIDAFISKQTETIEKEYQRQLNAVRNNRDKINAELTKINGASRSSNGTFRKITSQEKESILNSAEMQQAIQILKLNLDASFNSLSIDEKFKRVKAEFQKAIQDFNNQEINLTTFKDRFNGDLTAIFTGIGTQIVSDTKDVQNKIKNALSNYDIDLTKLEKFGFDASMVKKGQDMVDVYNQLQTALNGYIQSLQDQKTNLNTTELSNAQKLHQDLTDAINATTQAESGQNQTIKITKTELESLLNTLLQLKEPYDALRNSKIPTPDGLNETKTAIEDLINTLTTFEGKQKALSNIQSAVTRWMGFYQVLNLTKRAINDMKQHIQELDTVMTKIAVVTNMSQSDLWGQISRYSEIARQYGVAIKGVYEVSQIYYQQGLNKSDTMNLTVETLKMARIAGIDYATAADYMTTAIRGFKLEMSEANHVTDVFSNLAAHTASDTEELATAISKTASSAEAVGASFEATSAMIATMVSVTRESATNIGTALKSVISRYGEMTSDPTKLVDSEGEEMSLNRVDKALKSIGITIQDTNGQFRAFDDVILELGEKWDSLDKNAQRYIATIMAGNRQQSRFLALVSNVEEYKRALELANNSEDVSELQTLKTLDSIDAKIERMKVTVQEFYTGSGLEVLYKNILDTITNVINSANSLPKAFGNIPVVAISIGMQVVTAIKNVLTLIITAVQSGLQRTKIITQKTFSEISNEAGRQGQNAGRNFVENFTNEMRTLQGKGANKFSAFFQTSAVKLGAMVASTILSTAGAALSVSAANKYGASTSITQDKQAAGTAWLAAGLNTASGALSGAVTGAAIGGTAGPWGAVAGAIIGGLVNGWSAIDAAIQMSTETFKRNIELAEKAETEAKQKATLDKGVVSDLQTAYDKLKQLSGSQYESAEAMQEYHDYMNQLADSYPALVSAMELNGNQIITLEALERSLAQARADAAASTLASVEAEKNRLLIEQQGWNEFNSDINKIELIPNLLNVNDSAEQILEQYLQRIPHMNLTADIDNTVSDEESLIKLYNGFFKSPTSPGEYGDEALDTKSENWEQTYEENKEKIVALLNQDLLEYQFLVEKQTQYIDALKKAVNNNKDLNYATLTGIEGITEENLEGTIQELSGKELYDALVITRKYAQDGVDKIANDLLVIGKAISQSSANVLVTNNLNNNSKTASGIDLNQYREFLSNSISRIYDYAVNYTQGSNLTKANNVYEALVDYIEQNQVLADDLIKNLSYSSIKGINELNTFLEEHEFTTENGIDENIINSIRKDYNKTTQNIRTNFYNAIKQYVGSISDEGGIGRKLWRLFDRSNTSNNLIGDLIPSLQAALPRYQELIEDGYTVAAENYLSGLTTLYSSIGQLGDSQQKGLLSIVQSLDLTDVTSIDTAISNFETLGYTQIAEDLKFTRDLIASNISLSIAQMVSDAHKTVESAEKVVANVGKAMEYSDALEEAQKIISQSDDTDRLADDLIKFDVESKKWVLTQDALNESYEQVVASNKQAIADLSARMSLIQSGISSKIAEIDNAENIHFTQDDFSGVNWSEIVGLSETDEGYQEAVDAQINKFNNTIETLFTAYTKDFSEQKTTDDWETYYKKWLDEQDADEQQLRYLETYLDNAPITALMNMDFSAIAGGTATDQAKENFKTWLHQLNSDLDDKAETIWNDLLNANFGSFEEATGYKVSTKDKQSAIAAKVQKYKTAIEEIQSGKTFDQLSEVSQLVASYIVGIRSYTQSGDSSTILANLYSNLKGLIDGTNYTLDQYNADIAALTTKVKGIGLEKAAGDLLSGGFSLTEFANFLTNFKDLDIDQFFTGDQFTYEGYEGLFELDTNGNYQVAKDRYLEVLLFFDQVLGLGLLKESEAWKNYMEDEVAKKISNNAKNNTGKQIAASLQTMASAKLGDQIDISKWTTEMKSVVGAGANDTILTIESEERAKALLLLLKDSINAFNGEGADVLLASYTNIIQGITSSINKGEVLSKMASSSVNIADAQTYLKNKFGADGEKLVNTGMDKTYLTNFMGYIYDEYNNVYIPTLKTIKYLESDLASAIDNGASTEYINNLRARINNLKYELGAGKTDSALETILQNYSSVTEDMIAQFKTAFPSLDTDKIFTQIGNTNTYSTDIIALLTAVGSDMSDAAKTIVTSIAQSYIGAISTGRNYSLNGVTNVSEQQEFGKLFQEITGEELTDEDWTSDSVKGMVLSVEASLKLIQSARQKIKEMLEASGETGVDDAMIDAEIVKAIQGTNFEAIANGTAEQSAIDDLRSQLELLDIERTSVENAIQGLIKGDTAAIKRLESAYGYDFNITDKDVIKIQQSQVQSMQDAISHLINADQLITSEDIATLSEYGITFQEEMREGGQNATNAALLLYQHLVEFVTTGAITMSEVENTAKSILDAQWENAGYGRGQAALNLLSNGKLTKDSISSFADTWQGGSTATWFDENGNLTAGLAQVFEINQVTGDLEMLPGVTAKQVLSAIMTATDTQIDEETEEYRAAYSQTVDAIIAHEDSLDVGKQIASKLQEISSAGIGAKINVSTLPDELKAKLGADSNGIYEIVSTYQRDSILMALEATSLNSPEAQAALREIQQNIRSKRTQGAALASMISTSVSLDDAEAYNEAFLYGTVNDLHYYLTEIMHYEYDTISKTYKATQDTLNQLENDLKYSDTTPEEARRLQAQIDQTRYELGQGRLQEALLTSIQNASKLSSEAYAELQNAIEANTEETIDWENLDIARELADGEGVELDVPALIELLSQLGIGLSDAVNSALQELVDNYTSSIQNAVSLTSSGTTSNKEIEDFVQKYREKVEGAGDIEAKDIFHWDPILNTWVLNAEAMKAYTTAIAAELEKDGLAAAEETGKLIETLTTRTLAQAVDISSFLSAEDKGDEGQAYQKLKQQLVNFYTQIGKEAPEALAEVTIGHLTQGGAEAVADAQEIAKAATGAELSSEEFQRIFSPLAEKYTSLASKLADVTIGQHVTGDLYNELDKIEAIDHDTGLVKSVQNMSQAYKNIYEEMKGKAGITRDQLNSVYAQYLTASEQTEIDVISALNDAMGMTYDALGTLLNSYNTTLEEVASNLSLYGAEKIGGGKLRIYDFETFASMIGIGGNGTEEYTTAFKAYNDSLIALDTATRDTIYEEISAIIEAQPGQRINLTTLVSQIDESILNMALRDANALITNGILTLNPGADMADVIKRITEVVQDKGTEAIKMSKTQAAALKDAVSGIISNIVSLVQTGAEGSLTNEQREQLSGWAEQNGAQIDFTQTAEGFKLTENSLFELYESISKVNSLSASKLIPTIQSMNKQYTTLSGAMAAYKEALEKNELSKASALSKIVSSLSNNPDSFKYMDRELPDSIQSAVNHYESAYAGQAAITASSKSGTMAVTDAYAILSAIIEQSGAETQIGNMQAGNLLGALLNSIGHDKDGNAVVDFTKAEFNDYKALAAAYLEAIDTIRQAQHEKEIVVNELNSESNKFNINDILADGEIDSTKLQSLVQNSDALQKALNNITLNVTEFGEDGTIQEISKGLGDILKEETWQNYLNPDQLKGLLTTFQNTDWTMDELEQQIRDLFGPAGEGLTVDVTPEGDITVKYSYEDGQINPVVTLNGQKVSEKVADVWTKLLQKKDAQGNEATQTVTYTIEGQSITAQVDYNTGNVIYSVQIGDKTVTAENEASIRTAIADLVPTLADAEIQQGGEGVKYTIQSDEIEVEVLYTEGDIKFTQEKATGGAAWKELGDLEDELRQRYQVSTEVLEDEDINKNISLHLDEDSLATLNQLESLPTDHNIDVNITYGGAAETSNDRPAFVNEDGSISSVKLKTEVDDSQIALLQQALNDVNTTRETINQGIKVPAAYSEVSALNTALQNTINKLNTIGNKHITVTTTVTEGDGSQAKGNVALAKGTRSTLMGELGPELWVSNGHYYVAGASGAEFVDLPEDAIVFNHLQTRSLLTNGKSGRGTPLVSENAAVALAHGNINGGQARVTVPNIINNLISNVSSWWNGLWGTSSQEYTNNKKAGNNKATDTDTTTTLTSSQKSKLSTLISDLISKGFDLIDWDDIEKELGASLTAELKTAAQGSLTEFVKSYSTMCDKTVEEMNQLYFDAWEAELGTLSESFQSAVEGLTYFTGGSAAGSSADISKILAEYDVNIWDVVDAGLASYNAELKQFTLTDIDALKDQFGVELSGSAVQDSLRESVTTIGDYLTDLFNGELDNTDLSQLQAYLKLNGFEELSTEVLQETVNGWTISLDKAAELIEKVAANQTLTDLQKAALTDTINDATIAVMDTVTGLISDGMEGSLSNADFTNLQSFLKANGLEQINLTEVTQTAEGLKLSTAEATKLYYELKKVNEQAAQIVFDELVENLEESNDNYKTTTSLLSHIVDLTQKIQDNEQYSDEKIKQYQQELSLAKEIAQVRATTEDESMNWLDADIPGALNNPINYINDWIDVWKDLGEAGSDKTIDFTKMYNMIKEVNTQAGIAGTELNFLGYTLNGTEEAFDQMVNAAIGALGTDADNNYGVLLSKMGTGLTSGVSEYSDDVDSAIHTMAQSQIKILDGLIQMFEMIVAMENFSGLDTDKNGLLDWKEIFNTDGLEESATDFANFFRTDFKTAVQKVLDTALTDNDMAAALDSIKVGGNTMREIFEYATGAITSLTYDMTSGDYALAISAFYNALKDGDYDLNSIAEALTDQLTGDGNKYKGTIEYGDFVLDFKYDVKLTKTESGEYTTSDGKKYTNADQAAQAQVLLNAGATNDTITFDEVKCTSTGTITVGKLNFTVQVDATGEETYNGEDSLDAAVEQAWHDSGSTLELEEWKIEQEVVVIPSVKEVKADSLDDEQIDALVGKTFEDVKKEWDNAVSTGTETAFEAKWGFKFDEKTTEDDFNKMKETLGIKDDRIELTLYIKNLAELAEQIKAALGSALTLNMTSGSGEATEVTNEVTNQTFNIDSASAIEAIAAIQSALLEALQVASDLSNKKIETDTSTGQKNVQALKDLFDQAQGYADALSNTYINISTNSAETIMQTLAQALRDAASNLSTLRSEAAKGPITLTVETTVSDSGGEGDDTQAKGNVALAAGSRSVLMGELGPELYVSNGRYHIAGRNGAEFVDLPKDAIVFNHLQTARLLSTGSSGRGTPITNEYAAVSFATGNATGEAMASAQQTLDTLKQLRAMWQSIANTSISDLVTLANDTNTDSDGGNKVDPKTWIETVERWYNWLQKIAQLEKDITYEEQLRNKINSDRDRDGEAYYQSQKRSLAALREQVATEKDLLASQQQYFALRQSQMNESPMSAFYTFDSAGQLKWNDAQQFYDGNGNILQGGFQALEELWTTLRPSGQAKYTPQQQYELAQSWGLGQYMLYDANGNKIEPGENGMDDDFYINSLQALMDKVDADKEEMQSLHDSIEDYQKEILSLEQKQNELLQEMRDNQIALEDKIVAAIEEREQKLIDELQDTRDALEDSAEKYINGLSDALNKERQMYNQNTSNNELGQLRRQLGILERSGGSASQIAALQKSIASKEQDSYFTQQQNQIDAIQQASDLEIERLDAQIDLMNQQLEFSKAHGMLWAEVEQIMTWSVDSIVSFLCGNTADYQTKSTLSQSVTAEELAFLAEQWVAWRDDDDKFSPLYESNNRPVYTDITSIGGEKIDGTNNPILVSANTNNATNNAVNAATSTSSSSGIIGSSTGTASQTTSKKTIIGTGDEDYNKWLTQQATNIGASANWMHSVAVGGGYSNQDLYVGVTKHNADVAADALKKAGVGNGTWIYSQNYVYDRSYAQGDAYANWELGNIKKDLEDLQAAAYGSGTYANADPAWIANKMAVYSEVLRQNGYTEGGSVSFTGITTVHGTPTHPEYFLDAEETQMWKHDILGNNNSSLTSRLLGLRKTLSGIEGASNYTNNVDSGINIEHVEVNMNVEEIANDYDARRAGETALDEIVKIARKSSSSGIRR